MPKNRPPAQQSESVACAAAASRASWIGKLQFKGFSVPVKAYSAIASPESCLHQIHVGCGRRVSVHRVCSKHGTLDSSKIGRAFAYSSDLLVELSNLELAKLLSADEKTIVIERFFSPDQLDFTLLAGRTLYLAPANLAALDSFRMLKEAFDQKKAWALGRTVFSQKRQLVVIHSRDEAVLLHTLHDPALRRMPQSCHRNGRPLSRSEVRALARAMAKDCSAPIAWSDYSDNYHRQLAALVAGKVAAKTGPLNSKRKAVGSTRPKPQPRTRVASKAA